MYAVLYFCRDWFCRISLKKGLHVRLTEEFGCPEVTLCGWQDVKIQLKLTSFLLISPAHAQAPAYTSTHAHTHAHTHTHKAHMNACTYTESAWPLRFSPYLTTAELCRQLTSGATMPDLLYPWCQYFDCHNSSPLGLLHCHVKFILIHHVSF